MMKIKSYVIILLLFMTLPALSMSMLVEAEVQKIDTANKMIVLDGKVFKLDIDIKQSEYNNEFDRKKEVKLWQVKVGQTYFFNLVANQRLSKNSFNEVVFIADSEPGE